VLLSIWFVVTFVVGYFARDLTSLLRLAVQLLGRVPGCAGRLLPDHLVLRTHMNKLDQEHGVAEEE
jgi:uncharacterized membrane protein